MIKVNYDPQTSLIKGYYRDSIKYTAIPEPFIEITDEQYQENSEKQMCVIDGIYQEYAVLSSILLEQEKALKIAQCQTYLQSTDWQASAFLKYGRPIDDGVKENCLKAKELKNKIEACTTLEQLEKINVNFD